MKKIMYGTIIAHILIVIHFFFHLISHRSNDMVIGVQYEVDRKE